jgi:nucleoside phosphorylase
VISVTKIFQKIRSIFWNSPASADPLANISVLIVTILDVEYYAAHEIFFNGHSKRVTVDGLDFQLGSIPSLASKNQKIQIALVCAGAPGLTTVSALISRVCHRMPNIDLILVCGIAGGYPNPDDLKTHTRLGDILLGINTPQDVSLGKETNTGFEVTPEDYNVPDINCRVVAQRFRRDAESQGSNQEPPWETFRKNAAKRLQDRCVNTPQGDYRWELPEVEDKFYLVEENGEQIKREHPRDAWRERFPNRPKLLCGAIDSGNYVGKNSGERDQRRHQSAPRKPIGYEMEGAAVAKTATESRHNYFQVRGVADYQDSWKNNVWHPTAALRAAAMARCIVEHRLPSSHPGKTILTTNILESQNYESFLPDQTPKGTKDIQLLWAGSSKIDELVASLQEKLDTQAHEEVLSIASELEIAAQNGSLPNTTRSRAALAAARALVIVCIERGYLKENETFQERVKKSIQVLLDIAASG